MLEPDLIDPRENGTGIRWMISCDKPGCGEHVHLGIPRPGLDPRLGAGISGWVLDKDNLDFCPNHAEIGKALKNERLFPDEE